MASGAGNRAVGAYLREEARSAEGRELAPPLRAEMESRLGADLSAVRLHTSTAAAESANALRARAFTVDQDVVFAAGEYRPGDPGGRALIAHELAHTVQQARGGPAPAGTDRTERAAAAASAAGARGTAPAPAVEGSAVGVARVAAGEQTQEQAAPEKPDSLGFWGDLLVDELAGVAVGSGLQQQMLKAAVIGFFAELDRQIQDPKSRADIHAGAMDLAKSGNQEKMIAAYYAGAAAGLVSPLTDLLGIGVLLEQLQAFGGKLATGVLKGEIDLIDEVTGLIGAYEDFKYHLAASLIETIKEHPEDLFFFGSLQDVAVRKAGEAGRTGARRVVAAISEKDGDKPAAAPETAKQILTQHTEAEKAGAASALTSKATRARQAIFHTHPERLGYDVGEAVGSAVGNLLIAVFTEGVGNAVTRIAGEIGRVCPVLARGAEALAEIGKAITAVENAIGALVEGALSTLKGLGRILGPFRTLMTRLRNFLGKVLGRATQLEAAALRAAESTAPKLAPKAVPGLPGPGKAGTPHTKPSAAPKRGRPGPGGGAVNDNDVPLRRGETVKEPAPKAADPTARPEAPEPHPQSGVQPAARATEEQAEEQAAQQVAVNAPPPAHTPTTAVKTPPPKKPATLKVVPPPKGAPASVKPVSPKGTTGPGKKPVTAATKAALAAKRAEARAIKFKLAAPAARFTAPLTLAERSMIVEHLFEQQPLTGAMKDRLRTDARDMWKKATNGKGKQPGGTGKYQVHHKVPLEFAHDFPRSFPNDPNNLILMETRAHTEWHTMINAEQRASGRLTPETVLDVERKTASHNEGAVFVIRNGKVVPAL
ncbi:eCIS core domain-containing protein [Streptomyces goshikiensis]|uniref:eCIS core domain-containing protein n=1 Tax=Streptomyces goshikiensis TaxID=1942 RepID=UPI003722CA56